MKALDPQAIQMRVAIIQAEQADPLNMVMVDLVYDVLNELGNNPIPIPKLLKSLGLILSTDDCLDAIETGLDKGLFLLVNHEIRIHPDNVVEQRVSDLLKRLTKSTPIEPPVISESPRGGR